ncbi:hypothetical protein SVIOM74S_03023 [Streptomyces violarus]
MRALRILLITVVILGGLFVAADRLAVHFAEGEVADRLKSRENLSTTPDVSINGFPFLTQVAGGELDDVEVGIDGYEAATADGSEQPVDDLRRTSRASTSPATSAPPPRPPRGGRRPSPTTSC